MQAAVSLDQTVEALRELEIWSYQLAFYILQDERLAAEAGEQALLAMGREQAFHLQSPAERREQVKKMIMRKALIVSASSGRRS
ncbi:hypothetical protein BBD42_04790 [Paenibacillus sp. BIHB 4019]|uniref:Uncharacterized protein n=1 Tax=Paenibacillus sp. BIHB 4019 TaxID=1870819 RepID=A0A1B2DDR0_9BACL|nr:hypothetical protein [Paenibacillus sp. BIHB 4019]ANY65858.1 hypothetical protein BBD42_04790 [Paenibacillus sp. BIHB 4019]